MTVPAPASALDAARRAFHPHVPPPRDPDGPKARGLGADAGAGAVAGGPSGNVIVCYVQGTAQATTLLYDQAWFFSQLADAPINASTYAIAQVTPAVDAFSNSQIADFLTYEPMFLQNANIVAASADAVISGMRINAVRNDPFGNTASAQQYQAAYQTAADFQADRGQFPLDQVIDGYTYVRALSPIQVAAATYTVSFTFGQRQDRRAQVPRPAPIVVRSVNGK